MNPFDVQEGGSKKKTLLNSALPQHPEYSPPSPIGNKMLCAGLQLTERERRAQSDTWTQDGDRTGGAAKRRK